MNTSLTLTNDQARGLAELDAPCELAEHKLNGNVYWYAFVTEMESLGIARVIFNGPTGVERRWVKVMQVVVQGAEGKLYAAEYDQGLTEKQYERPFEYAGVAIEFAEVEAVEVTTVEYRPVKR